MQKKEAKKVILIGLDAANVKSVEKYIRDEELPNIARLKKQGIWAENCLVPHPTITPPNWTGIVTGAWPGTHGITCFHLHKPGMPLDQTYMGLSAQDCQAEYIWDAAKKANKKTILFNYFSTWNLPHPVEAQVGGTGFDVNVWCVNPDGTPRYSWDIGISICPDQLFSTEFYPDGIEIELDKAFGWKNIDESKNNLEAKIIFGGNIQVNMEPLNEFKPKEWYLLIQDTQGKGYDKVNICRSKDGKDIMTSLPVGQWSEKIIEEFETDKGKKRGAFKCKLLELSEDAEKFKLYFTGAGQLDGWSVPESIALELENLEEFPVPVHSAFKSLNADWIDIETFLEVLEIEHTWMAESAYSLLKNHEWDLFFMHAHCPDHCYHAFMNKLDPGVNKNEKELIKYQKAEKHFYQSLDKMIGRILKSADNETLIIITSDHGAVPTINALEPDFEDVSVGKILREAGLTVYKENPRTHQKEIDWRKTKAIVQRSIYVYVNLKGRDPEGIVEPGREYEQIREKIIKLLYEYTDPQTGKKPIALALKKEDARVLGLYGDRIGDIVYLVNPEYGHEHGLQLATGEYGVGSMRGLFIMSGPGIKEDHILKRTMWLTDITPTICYLLNIPVPKDTEGAIIYQAFEDPNARIKEMETLKKNYTRLRNAYKAERAITHSYNE